MSTRVPPASANASSCAAASSPSVSRPHVRCAEPKSRDPKSARSDRSVLHNRLHLAPDSCAQVRHPRDLTTCRLVGARLESGYSDTDVPARRGAVGPGSVAPGET